MIPLKSKEDLDGLRESGKILARVMRELKGFVRPGIVTSEIDNLAQRLILQEKALPAFRGYRGYPACVCVSVNEEVVHGIPGTRRLEDGDIASLDLGINYRGYFSDAALTLPVGRASPEPERLIKVTKEALALGIDKVRIENRLSDISYAIQDHVEKSGFSVVRQFVGHGIGIQLHEEPEIPNFGAPGQGPVLKSGMVLAIEPMVNMGSWECEILEDGWTVVTKDKLPSAHFEHIVAVTDAGPEVLTE